MPFNPCVRVQASNDPNCHIDLSSHFRNIILCQADCAIQIPNLANIPVIKHELLESGVCELLNNVGATPSKANQPCPSTKKIRLCIRA
jgi:hypothetical protein